MQLVVVVITQGALNLLDNLPASKAKPSFLNKIKGPEALHAHYYQHWRGSQQILTLLFLV